MVLAVINGSKSGLSALRKGRCSQPGGIYFVTMVTRQRIPWFQVFDFAAIMCRCLTRPSGMGDAANLCWVVMPDHVHFLLQLGEMPLDRIVQGMKSRSAIQLNREIGRRGQFWQPAYYDHALRKEEDLLGVARYIVANPLRAGLAKRAGDYPFWNATWL